MVMRMLSRPHELFFEKAVDSFPKLMEEIAWLDLDSGVRTFGDYGGKRKEFVFITRSPHDTYTLMVYEKKKMASNNSSKKKKEPVPGKRLLVKEFQTVEELRQFLQSLLSRPVKAFVY